MNTFVDDYGYISEYHIKNCFLKAFETVSKTSLDRFLELIEDHIPTNIENGYMKRYSLQEIILRLRGTYLSSGVKNKQLHSLNHIYESKNILLPQASSDPRINGSFLDQTTFQNNASSVPPLEDSLMKIKTLLTQIKAATRPGSREANLPLTSPILKLTLIEDPDDKGEVNEDLIVRIYKEAFPSMTEPQLYRILALGRVGNVRERRVDYMRMLSTIERLFITYSNT